MRAMTAKEAIETIKIAIAEVEWEYPMDYAVAFKMAIKALEKEIPQKPIPVYAIREPQRIISHRCPNCNCEDLGCNEYRFACCEECGQDLDWEGE